MDINNKLIRKIMEIVKVTGFNITTIADPSVGNYECSWQMTGDYYFDNLDELEDFRTDIKKFYTGFCGDEVKVYTFEELNKRKILEK